MTRSPDLAGRTAVVTGASRGIGAEVARALAVAGARVVLVGRDALALERRAALMEGRATIHVCDLSDRPQAEHAPAEVTRLLGAAPDILVNNAGEFQLAPVHEMTPDAFERTIDVNLIAPFLLARGMLPQMRERGSGHIVTIGSIADRFVFPENGAYAAGKFGLRALHEVMREELRGSGVRTTLVSPGPVDTPLWDAIGPEGREGFTPRARMLQPGAVADAVLYAVASPLEVNIDELRLSRA